MNTGLRELARGPRRCFRSLFRVSGHARRPRSGASASPLAFASTCRSLMLGPDCRSRGLASMWSSCDSTTMRADSETPMNDKPPRQLSWTDAAILGGAVLGILLGVSLLSFQAAVAMGVGAMAFVVYKLFTTKNRTSCRERVCQYV